MEEAATLPARAVRGAFRDFLGNIEALAAKPAMAGNFAETAHNQVEQPVRGGGHQVLAETPRAPQDTRFEIDVVLDLHRSDVTMH